MNCLKLVYTLIFATLFFSLASSLPIYVKPLDSNGTLQPNKNFTYQFNFTLNSNCANVVFSNVSRITTGSDGVGFIDLDISTISQVPNYLCEYKNGNLRKVHNLSDQLFKNIYAQNINVSQNVTASWFKGIFNWITDLSQYLNFNGTQLDFNETRLNGTIDSKISISVNNSFNQSLTDTLYNPSYNTSLYVQSNNGSDIQAKINACPSSGCIIVIPSGIYNLSSKVTLKSNLTIIGHGKETTKIYSSADIGFYGANLDNVVIKYLTIDGMNLNDGQISLSNATRILIENNKITGSPSGTTVSLGISESSSYIKILNNLIENHYDYGINLDPTTEGYIHDVIIEGNSFLNVQTAIAVQRNSSYVTISNNYIKGMIIASNGIQIGKAGISSSYGIGNVVDGNIVIGLNKTSNGAGINAGDFIHNSIISNNYIEGYNYGIYFDTHPYYITISNNQVFNNSYGILQSLSGAGCHYCNIVGNVVDSNDNYGMYFNAESDIRSNIIRNSGLNGIVLDEYTDYSSIIGNTIINSGQKSGSNTISNSSGLFTTGNVLGLIIEGNKIFDNQETKTQSYAIFCNTTSVSGTNTYLGNYLLSNQVNSIGGNCTTGTTSQNFISNYLMEDLTNTLRNNLTVSNLNVTNRILANVIESLVDIIFPSSNSNNPKMGSSFFNITSNSFYVYNGTAWKYVELGGHFIIKNLSDLSDLNISSIENGQVITYDSNSGKWTNKQPSMGDETDPIFMAENSSLWAEAKNKYNSIYEATTNQWNENYTTYSKYWANHSLWIEQTYGEWFYNMTTPFTNWLEIFAYNYNQTTPANEYADSINTSLSSRIDGISGGNSSFNQTLTDSLYSEKKWNYNQTTPAMTFEYNQTIPAIAYADTKSSPSDCPAGQVVQNTTTSGVQCIVPPSGSESDPIFSSNFSLFSKYWYNYSLIDQAVISSTSSSLQTNISTTSTNLQANITALNTSYVKWWYNYSLIDQLLISALSTNLQTNITALNTSYNMWWYNQSTPAITIANTKAIAGNCTTGQVVVNITASGVQCIVPPAGTEVDPIFSLNYTLFGKYWYNFSTVDQALISTLSTNLQANITALNTSYVKWWYNQTTPAINEAYANFYNKSSNVNVGNYNISHNNYSYSCYGNLCQGQIYYNGSSLIIKVN